MFRALPCPSSGARGRFASLLANRPRLRTLPPPHSYGNQRLQRRFDGLLMMGMVMPETCWAVSVRQSDKFYDWLLHLVGCFYLSDWRCTEPQTLNSLDWVFATPNSHSEDPGLVLGACAIYPDEFFLPSPHLCVCLFLPPFHHRFIKENFTILSSDNNDLLYDPPAWCCVMCAAQKAVLTGLGKKCRVPYFGVKHFVLIAFIYSPSRRNYPRTTDETTHTCEKWFYSVPV